MQVFGAILLKRDVVHREESGGARLEALSGGSEALEEAGVAPILLAVHLARGREDGLFEEGRDAFVESDGRE